MKRFAIIPASIFLGTQCATASDMSGALIIFPIAGGLAGLVIGAIICFVSCVFKRGSRAIWFSLPLYGVAGFILSILALNIDALKYRDKIVCSFGGYRSHEGGMVITVPQDITRLEVEQFYGLLTNRENTILSSHTFAVALIHQANGIEQVYLNIRSELDMQTEYPKIYDEVNRQMEIVLKRRLQGTDVSPSK